MKVIKMSSSKRTTLILAAIAMFSSAAFCQSISHPPGMSEAEVARIAKTVSVLDHVWLNAAHNRDTGTMGWLFSEGFVEVHPGGPMVNKAQQLAQIKNPSRGNLVLYPSDIQVRYVSPDVAILTDITHITGHSGGIAYNGEYRVIRVFAKQQGRWRAAGAGITRLTAPADTSK
ncbi:MAG: nuclear transport factor 2 family protein [Terriglobia bacterium]